MGRIHEMSTYHWEYNTETMLGRKLHTLFKLVLEDCRIKTESKIAKNILLNSFNKGLEVTQEHS